MTKLELEEEQSGISLRHYVLLLKENTIYRTLFVAYCVDNCGNWLTFVACISIIDRLGAGALDTSLFLICRLLPSFLFAGVLGPVADRYNKLNLLILCSLGSACSVCLIVLLLSAIDHNDKLPTLACIYALTLAQFSFSALYEPVRNSLLPLVVSEAELIVATSLDGNVRMYLQT